MILDPYVELYNGDALTVLKTFSAESVQCCITSPPYWGLRHYECDGQLGIEKTPEEYVSNLVDVFRAIKSVLKKDGTCWLNLGDSYAGGGRGWEYCKEKGKQLTNKGVIGVPKSIIPRGLKAKDLVGIPWRVAFALQADGWYLRQDIVWFKPNNFPESVTDRCTKAHEYIFLLSKSQKYYFDNEAIKEKTVTNDDSVRDRDNSKLNNTPGRTRMAGLTTNSYEMRNKRSVWEINTAPYKEAHFATFPPELVQPMVLAGCPIGGTVIDPFAGSGTTLEVAKSLNRKSIGIELNPNYCELIKKRVSNVTLPMDFGEEPSMTEEAINYEAKLI
jgi:DNA modification methylase